MSKIIDFEQEFMRCWDIVQDLKLLSEYVNDGSNYTETVKGMAAVYELRFTQAWESFESTVQEYYAMRDKKDISADAIDD